MGMTGITVDTPSQKSRQPTCDETMSRSIYKSRFWVEKGAWKHREKHVVFFSAIDFLAQVHKV